MFRTPGRHRARCLHRQKSTMNPASLIAATAATAAEGGLGLVGVGDNRITCRAALSGVSLHGDQGCILALG
jgi:hypothetical protein